MGYHEAKNIIWAPDEHPLENVVEASLIVLTWPGGAESADAHQASYLIATFRPR